MYEEERASSSAQPEPRTQPRSAPKPQPGAGPQRGPSAQEKARQEQERKRREAEQRRYAEEQRTRREEARRRAEEKWKKDQEHARRAREGALKNATSELLQAIKDNSLKRISALLINAKFQYNIKPEEIEKRLGHSLFWQVLHDTNELPNGAVIKCLLQYGFELPEKGVKINGVETELFFEICRQDSFETVEFIYESLKPDLTKKRNGISAYSIARSLIQLDDNSLRLDERLRIFNFIGSKLTARQQTTLNVNFEKDRKKVFIEACQFYSLGVVSSVYRNFEDFSLMTDLGVNSLLYHAICQIQEDNTSRALQRIAVVNFLWNNSTVKQKVELMKMYQDQSPILEQCYNKYLSINELTVRKHLLNLFVKMLTINPDLAGLQASDGTLWLSYIKNFELTYAALKVRLEQFKNRFFDISTQQILLEKLYDSLEPESICQFLFPFDSATYSLTEADVASYLDRVKKAHSFCVLPQALQANKDVLVDRLKKHHRLTQDFIKICRVASIQDLQMLFKSLPINFEVNSLDNVDATVLNTLEQRLQQAQLFSSRERWLNFIAMIMSKYPVEQYLSQLQGLDHQQRVTFYNKVFDRLLQPARVNHNDLINYLAAFKHHLDINYQSFTPQLLARLQKHVPVTPTKRLAARMEHYWLGRQLLQALTTYPALPRLTNPKTQRLKNALTYTKRDAFAQSCLRQGCTTKGQRLWQTLVYNKREAFAQQSMQCGQITKGQRLLNAIKYNWRQAFNSPGPQTPTKMQRVQRALRYNHRKTTVLALVILTALISFSVVAVALAMASGQVLFGVQDFSWQIADWAAQSPVMPQLLQTFSFTAGHFVLALIGAFTVATAVGFLSSAIAYLHYHHSETANTFVCNPITTFYSETEIKMDSPAAETIINHQHSQLYQPTTASVENLAGSTPLLAFQPTKGLGSECGV